MAHKKGVGSSATVATPTRNTSASRSTAARRSKPATSSFASAAPSSIRAWASAWAATTRCSRWSTARSSSRPRARRTRRTVNVVAGVIRSRRDSRRAPLRRGFSFVAGIGNGTRRKPYRSRRPSPVCCPRLPFPIPDPHPQSRPSHEIRRRSRSSRSMPATAATAASASAARSSSRSAARTAATAATAAASGWSPTRASTRWSTSATSAASRRSAARTAWAGRCTARAARTRRSACRSAPSVINVDTDEVIGDLTDARPAPAGRAGRPGRPRQHPFQELGQPRAAQGDAGQRGRGARAEARAQGAGRRRPARLSERRQVARFIRAVSAATPKVADYPFTTLQPNLGVVRIETDQSFVIADIPGLIEGAAEGAGLGIQFLQHVARTRLLLHLVDIAPIRRRAPIRSSRCARSRTSCKQFDPALLKRPRWLVLNKADLMAADEREQTREGRSSREARLEAAVVPGLGDRARRHLADRARRCSASSTSRSCARKRPRLRSGRVTHADARRGCNRKPACAGCSCTKNPAGAGFSAAIARRVASGRPQRLDVRGQAALVARRPCSCGSGRARRSGP